MCWKGAEVVDWLVIVLGALIVAIGIMAVGFVLWALLLERQTNAKMRAFEARWATLTKKEREEEINRVRASRAVLERCGIGGG